LGSEKEPDQKLSETLPVKKSAESESARERIKRGQRRIGREIEIESDWRSKGQKRVR
jgi:hypothetical protein